MSALTTIRSRVAARDGSSASRAAMASASPASIAANSSAGVVISVPVPPRATRRRPTANADGREYHRRTAIAAVQSGARPAPPDGARTRGRTSSRATRGQGHDHHRRRRRHGPEGRPDVRRGGRQGRLRRRDRGDGRVGRGRRDGGRRRGDRRRGRRVPGRPGEADGRPRGRDLRPGRRPVQQRRDHARGRPFGDRHRRRRPGTRSWPSTSAACISAASTRSRGWSSRAPARSSTSRRSSRSSAARSRRTPTPRRRGRSSR